MNRCVRLAGQVLVLAADPGRAQNGRAGGAGRDQLCSARCEQALNVALARASHVKQ